MTSRALDGLKRLVDQWLRALGYVKLYPCRVLQQRGDGTLDLIPDDASIQPPQAIPYRTLPGLAFTVPADARCLLAYEGGDPSRPVVVAWEPGAATLLTLQGGTAAVIRAGDGVVASTSMAAWMLAVTTKLNAGTGVVPTAPSTLGTTTGGNPSVKA